MKRYFRDTSNLLSFCIALIPAILLFVFSPNKPVPYTILAICLLLMMLVSWLCVKLFLDLRSIPAQNRISIVNCINNRCICRPDKSITFDSIVSFSEEIGECENPLCFGVVETITVKGLAQIIIHPYDNSSNSEELLTYIHNHKDKILVRPTVSSKSFQTIHEILMKEDY